MIKEYCLTWYVILSILPIIYNALLVRQNGFLVGDIHFMWNERYAEI